MLDAPILLPRSFQANAMRFLYPAQPQFGTGAHSQDSAGCAGVSKDDGQGHVREAERTALLRAAGMDVHDGSGRRLRAVCAIHEYFKINAAVWVLWMRVLATDPAAVLVLPHRPFRAEAEAALRANAASGSTHDRDINAQIVFLNRAETRFLSVSARVSV
jgi:hypothetical protein